VIDVKSNLRVAELYNQKDPEQPKAPKNLTRKLLYFALNLLLSQNKIELSSIIGLEPDHSEKNDLINKVYKPMGFVLLTVEKADPTHDAIDTVNVMTATVGKVLEWCTPPPLPPQ
jgi:hypothetical protein